MRLPTIFAASCAQPAPGPGGPPGAGGTRSPPVKSRVAEMAASGMTNHQIAQAIFLAPGTVEKHLTSVYAKLAVSSRHQLAGALMPIPPV